MRGKHVYHEDGTGIFRITPADAGKTLQSSHESNTSKDHPRGCGENLKRLVLLPKVLGSPPRMRGKLRSIPERGAYLRITPADAGKTQLPRHVEHSREDHPRGCGENDAVLRIPFNTSGSPPRMRGKLAGF